MSIQSKTIGPISVIFDEALPDELLVGLMVEDEGRYGRMQVHATVTPPEVRRLVKYLDGLLDTYVQDPIYGEEPPRSFFIDCERA